MPGHSTYISTFAIVFGIIHRQMLYVNAQRRCSQMNYHTLAEHGCTDIDFCKKTFNISYIKMPPYAPAQTVQKFLKECCKGCAKFSVLNTFANISQVTPHSIHSSHFVYPFLGSVTDKLVNGFYFIPVMHLPNAYYMTMRTQITLFHSIVHLLPLVTVCLLMAAIAGFICWIAEARSNTDQFPRSFLQGWFEGFWWSVVSMTTIGYGDKSPKTLIGRIFAIGWIFTGITVCGIVTAMLTTTTMDANDPKLPSMSGAKVGILKYRDYDAFLVTHHGGLLVEAQAPTFESSIYELINKLSKGSHDIDGILLDRYTIWSIFGNFSLEEAGNTTSNSIQRKEILQPMKEMVLSSVDYKHEVLAYGILVKNEEDYEFLNDIIRSRRFLLHTHWDHQWNKEQENFFHGHTPGIFDAERSYFRSAVLSLIGGIICICMFGLLYEFIRRNMLTCEHCSLVQGGDKKSQDKLQML